MVINLDEVATQAQFGEMVGISQQTVSDLVARGVLSESAPAGLWLLDYCANLREVAAGRVAAGDLDLAVERARLARAQAIKVERDNAIKAGDLAPVTVLEEILAKTGARIAGIFDAIPGQIHRRMPHLPASEIEAIRAEIIKARNIVAALSLDDVRDEDPESDETTDSANVATDEVERS